MRQLSLPLDTPNESPKTPTVYRYAITDFVRLPSHISASVVDKSFFVERLRARERAQKGEAA